ncbi:SLC5 family protein [Sedimentisphaera salicampi]|nr:sodium/solute symporter [Sedimentisphaera salicampi]
MRVRVILMIEVVMTFSVLDYIVFFGFIAAVLLIGTLKSRGEKGGEDFFLAGRGLKWWLIGFSLIAANISTEQFVGMSGNAASHIGLAIASYEWMAAIVLVIVAFFLLPFFLRAGIYTMPEFLEHRYNQGARFVMALATLAIYCLLLGAVTYSGALTIKSLGGNMGMDISLFKGSVAIGLIAMFYVASGGLKACAWADLLQGSALILGGAIILFFAMDKMGNADELTKVVDATSGKVVEETFSADKSALERFWSLNKERMNMFLPASDMTLPWTALIIGLWIPNFYYWGLNQYITQRTLGSASLAEGQKGIVFAAAMKVVVPFVIVVPGIMAFNLFAGNMQVEAIDGNTPVFAQYYKTNSDTEAIVVDKSPTKEEIKSWPKEDQVMLAVFENEEAINETYVDHAYVYPITQQEYQGIEANENVKFICHDSSVKSAFPTLSRELKKYNASVGDKAEKKFFLAYKYDTALAQLLGGVLPQNTGLTGFVLAALLGAVVSSLAALLNAASTIFSMDIFKKYLNPEISQDGILKLGRVSVFVFSAIAIFLAPQLGNPKFSSIFTVIQEGQGILSPGVLAVFAFGLISKKAPRYAGLVGLVLNAVVYIGLMLWVPELNFLNRMAICLGLCLVALTIMRIATPLKEPVQIKKNTTIELDVHTGARLAGVAVIVVVLLLYFLFSPIGLIR